MTKIKNLIFTFCFIILNFTYVNASEKVAFVDIDYIVQNSNVGKSALESIRKLDEKNINTLKNKTRELKDLEIEIQNKKNIISSEAYESEVKLFKEKLNNYKNQKNSIIKNFNDFKKKELDKIFAEITPVIKNYMDKNSVEILLDTKNIFMGNDNINLTEDILNEVNKSLN